MQDLLCTPASAFGLDMPSVEMVIVCAVPLIMALQKWASKPSSIVPVTRQGAEGMAAARQHEDELALSPDEAIGRNGQHVPPVVQVGNAQAQKRDFFDGLACLPEEIQCVVAQQLSNSDVATLSSVCHVSHQSFWDAEGVWLALGAREQLCLGKSGVAEFTRDAFRRAAFRLDCADLAELAGAPHFNADPKVFDEASHVMKGLMSKDVREVQLLCASIVPELESANFAAAGAAEAFLRRAHARKDLFSSQDLDVLDNAYDFALLQHNLMMDTLEEHLEDLETQMQSVEQQVCNDHLSLILDS